MLSKDEASALKNYLRGKKTVRWDGEVIHRLEGAHSILYYIFGPIIFFYGLVFFLTWLQSLTP